MTEHEHGPARRSQGAPCEAGHARHRCRSSISRATIEGDHALFEDRRMSRRRTSAARRPCPISRALPKCSGAAVRLDGVRILSPRIDRDGAAGAGRRTFPTSSTALSTCAWAGKRCRPIWVWASTCAARRSAITSLGTLTSPETFGNYGAGSALFWVDPELDVSFACLTAGVMTQAANIERFQKLSDLRGVGMHLNQTSNIRSF